MSNIINATLIHSDGSPTTFQCWDGFPEFLRRAEATISRGLRTGDTMDLSVIRIFAFDVRAQRLTEYQPAELIELERQAREMFRSL